MTSDSLSNDLAIIGHSIITCSHCFNMLILVVWHIFERTKPWINRLTHQLFEVFFTLSSLTQWNDCVKVFQRFSNRTQACWSRILQKKFFDSFSNLLESELDFLNCITWSIEKNCCVLINVSLFSELSSCIQHRTFNLGLWMSLA